MGASNINSEHDHPLPMAEINVTPFVDVMLVLLIIFMVTSPLLIAGVEVDLPETSAAPVSGQDEPLAISITKGGKVYIQNQAIALNKLLPKLRAITEEKRDRRIFIRGDKHIAYGEVMRVMDLVHNAGYTKVSLLTEIE